MYEEHTIINTFDKPGTVRISNFIGLKKSGNVLNVTWPAKSIVVPEWNWLVGRGLFSGHTIAVLPGNDPDHSKPK